MHAAMTGSAQDIERIAVIGAGAWGTALAATAVAAGRRVTLWAHEPEVAAVIARDRRNDAFLPGIDLPAGIAATADLATAVAGADAVLLVVPSQFLRPVCAALAGVRTARFKPYTENGQPVAGWARIPIPFALEN